MAQRLASLGTKLVAKSVTSAQSKLLELCYSIAQFKTVLCVFQNSYVSGVGIIKNILTIIVVHRFGQDCTASLNDVLGSR